MRETTPGIDLIARPSVDLGALERYLKTVGGESWLAMRRDHEEGLNPGQLLIEAAGRACYRSWKEGLNPNVTRVRRDQKEYFLNLLRSAHGSVLEHANYTFIVHDVSRVFCYDEETEVLTKDGWKPWPKIDGSELFASLNPTTGFIEYQFATERFEGDYEGPMYRLQSEQIDLLVTPQHRMWVQPVDTQAFKRREQPYVVAHAESLKGKRVKYQKTGLWRGQEHGCVDIPATTRKYVRRDGRSIVRKYPGASFPIGNFARFLGHWLAEGSINRHQIVLAQNRGPMLDEMAENVRAMGLSTYIPTTGHGCIRTHHTALRDFLASCGRAAHEKQVPQVVWRWGPGVLKTFLNAYAEADGSKRKDGNHTVIYTSSPEMADDLQIAAIRAGWSANIRVDDRVGVQRRMKTGQVFHNLRPSYVVSLVKTRTHPAVNRRKGCHDAWADYSGKVYCVKVPNGLLFVRRNGKPVVSGNTHELVRHRSGSAFSQESLRFVRLDDLPFRIPEVLEPLRPQIISILETLEEFQISAADFFELDKPGVPFHEKKEITSALRRLAPEGLSTVIFWTANVRTLRHTIQMRTDRGAEEEIRFVFNRIGEIMLQEAPLLFGDFVVEDGAWTTEFRKV